MDVRNNHSCAAKGDKILDWLIATELESNEREIEEDGGELEWKGGLVDVSDSAFMIPSVGRTEGCLGRENKNSKK